MAQRAVILAGGTGGLGRAAVQAFLAAGDQVVVPYRREQEFAALQQTVGAAASRLTGVVSDVTDLDSVAALVARCAQQHGRVDVLVNTVGGYAGGVNLWQTDPAVLEQQLTLNLRAGFVLARVALPFMLAQRSGVVVNVASRAAVDHGAGASAYAASKAAAVAMMDSLAAELRGTGVRVNSILPSIIDTPANRKAMPQADFSRWPQPEAIAEVILFLASPAARVIHGATIPVYGAEV
ncbi:MAG: SDR family oxidoreductase [Acidobacteriota bacterium]|nr:SDR family oxidoreductase [Acidobacteriota bacterium]